MMVSAVEALSSTQRNGFGDVILMDSVAIFATRLIAYLSIAQSLRTDILQDGGGDLFDRLGGGR